MDLSAIGGASWTRRDGERARGPKGRFNRPVNQRPHAGHRKWYARSVPSRKPRDKETTDRAQPEVFASWWWAWIGAGAGCLALLGCALHAHGPQVHGERGLPPAVRNTVERFSQADLCITPHDDLRHPGWAREEQSRLSSPGLPDPRPARWFVDPVRWAMSR